MADVRDPATETRLKIVIGIATAGRRDLLTQTIAHLAGQSTLPDSLFVCPAKPDDVDAAALAAFPAPAGAIAGGTGSCAQRNAILDAAEDADVVMVFRMAPIRAGHVRFDEAMPLYGWQEDVDFCRRLAPSGEIVSSDALRGVHMGAKRGRTSGVRLGYSQIANPIYLTRKGTVTGRWAFNLMWRNCAANVAGSLRPQGLVDRRGRLKGNLMAAADFVRGRLSPGRILSFK